MPSTVTTFEQLFDLEVVGENRFTARRPATVWKRIFGGLVVSQALAATMRTIHDKRPVHSLHSYFLLPGDPAIPLVFDVEHLREGKSFAARCCRVWQADKLIFILMASFHVEELGLEHSEPMPDVTPPERLESFADLQRKHRPARPRPMFEYFVERSPLDIRPEDPDRYFSNDKISPRQARQATWFKATSQLESRAHLHECVLAYASDMTLLDSTLVVHRRSVTDGSLQPASLDHTIWFHRPFRADEWLLFAQKSPNAGAARGLAFGHIYKRDGELVATVAQEGLIRPMNK